MKKIFTLILLCCVSLNAFAELTLQESQIIKLLTSGELRDLKVAAQQAHSAKIKNPEVMDVAAEILLRMHNNVFSHQVDTLAWIAKALGETKDNRYEGVLREVAVTQASRKLQSHAKKALLQIPSKDTAQYTLGMVQLPEGVHPLRTQTELNQELLSMIASGDLALLKHAVKQMVASKNQSQEVGDAVAEVLLTLYPRGFEYESDTLAWAAQALGVNSSGRYHNLLKQVSKESPDKRLKRHAKKAVKAHGKANGEQYVKGMSTHESKFL